MKRCQGRITTSRQNGYGGESIDVHILDNDGWYKLFLNKLMDGKISLDMVRTLWPMTHGYEGAKLIMETDDFKIELKPIQEKS